MPTDNYALFKDFIPLIASLIALLGGIVGIVWSSRNSRKLEQFKQQLEAASLANALTAELQIHLSTLNDGLNALKDHEEMMRKISAPMDAQGTFSFPRYTDPSGVYREAANKIGILPPDVVSKVTKAYTGSERLPDQIGQFADPDIPFDQSNTGKRMEISFANTKAAEEIYMRTRTIVADATLALRTVALGSPRSS